MTAITKLYDRLTPMERLSAFVEAAARKDLPELDRLNDTCPRKSYVMDDLAYTDGKRQLWLLAAMVQIQVDRLGFGAIAALLKLAHGSPCDPDRESTLDATRNLLARMKGCLDGWDEFCAEVGVDGDVAFSAYGLTARDRFETLCFCAGLDPRGQDSPSDEETKAGVLDLCRHAWRRISKDWA